MLKQNKTYFHKQKKMFYGPYGGIYVPETLIEPLMELSKIFNKYKKEKRFISEYNSILKNYVGRPTPLYYASNLSKKYGTNIYLKREDLCHTGAHKINNCIGQILLAKKMKKTRIVAETGAGQHGVATATAAALMNIKCDVFMGTVDIQRQTLNVDKMKVLGANVIPVDSGSKTLKDAVNEALRDWVATVRYTHYILGSALGPYPFPEIVKYFQSVIGRETKKQIKTVIGKNPDFLVACIGGGSNSIGLFAPFIKNKKIKKIGVEAGGISLKPGKHAARFKRGNPGIVHGMFTYVLQDKDGMIEPTHSVSAGLDYPAVGPEHSYYFKNKLVEYTSINDKYALKGFFELSKLEGIIPALESAHAVGYVIKNKSRFKKSDIIIVNLSGRGDKDMDIIKE